MKLVVLLESRADLIVVELESEVHISKQEAIVRIEYGGD